ncbi:MAG: flagellar basal body P-ring protein FlgI [Deltaproteobacteria bacterium]|nr:flagellar basal body P-ring protein FlgI [Deltaproteobacteria bacterium]
MCGRSNRLLKKPHLRCRHRRSSLRRTEKVRLIPHSLTPCIWSFLSSLREIRVFQQPAKVLSIIVLMASLLLAGRCEAARIKDIAFVEGVRPNQLVGYGLVVGLNGTGDKSSATYTMQSISNMLNRMGLKLDSNSIKVKNTASVLITAELPSFIKPGAKIDVLVSSIGDATSLQGGTLISTPLKGPDGSVYAVAQGAIALAGFSAGGQGANVSKNHQTAGKITDGALIEKEVPLNLAGRDDFFISLRSPDFTTAERMAAAINDSLKVDVAHAVDAGMVMVKVPEERRKGMVEYIASIETLDVKPDNVTKVVINERTGTVVIGENVRLSTVAISHGDISIEIKTQYYISQPPPLSLKGETVVVPVEKATVKEEKSRLILLPETVTLGEVVRALNLVGVTPRDLVAILQAIKAAGALQAELEII